MLTEKIFLGLYSILIAFLSVFMLFYSLRLPFPFLNLWTGYGAFFGRFEFAPLFAVIFLLSIYTLYLSLRVKRGDFTEVNSSEIGTVSVSFKAIEEMVGILLKKYETVKETKIKIIKKENKVNLKLYITVTPDAIIPELSSDIQKTVKEALESAAGVVVENIYIIIDDVYKAAQKRVK